ncbi:MAG: rhomboid family intramembrane serine protease [Ignavibacteria bacterium]|nr:MAG: rhomboid family intramembrane serine protease [Ignavibacteria bacterium]
MSYYDRDYYRPRGFRGFYLFPPVIKNIMIINIAVFFIQFIFDNLTFGGVPGWYVLNRYFSLNPLVGIDPAGQAFNFQIWQLITYQFMHGGFWHIFFNMFMLWMFGMEIENLWGSQKFLIFYLLAGITGGLFQLIFTPLMGLSGGFTVGASAAVFGVMVAFGMTYPDRYIFLLFPPIPIKAKYLIGFLVAIEYFSVGNAGEPIAHLAHLGGAASGFLFVLYDRKRGINFSRFFNILKDAFTPKGSSKNSASFRKPFRTKDENIIDAEFYEINGNSEEEIDQEEIDRILDKISRSGYQNLTEREKKILFEASKRS